MAGGAFRLVKALAAKIDAMSYARLHRGGLSSTITSRPVASTESRMASSSRGLFVRKSGSSTQISSPTSFSETFSEQPPTLLQLTRVPSSTLNLHLHPTQHCQHSPPRLP